MTTIIYNHKEKSMRAEGSKSKGLLGYDKEDKMFACEASDLDCAGVPDLPKTFKVVIEENGHSRIFNYVATKHTNDEDHEVISWLFASSDNIKFLVFND